VVPDAGRACFSTSAKDIANEMEIAASPGGVTFYVQVQPRASREAIAGERGDALKIHVTAPPVDDCANEALVQLLARRLNVPRAAVRIVAGEKSSRKRVVVAGVQREQVLALAATAERPAKKAKD
jgi:uncharacterized protein (TIGR00251 family)